MISFGIVYRCLQTQLIYFGVVVAPKRIHYHQVTETSGDMLTEQAE